MWLGIFAPQRGEQVRGILVFKAHLAKEREWRKSPSLSAFGKMNINVIPCECKEAEANEGREEKEFEGLTSSAFQGSKMSHLLTSRGKLIKHALDRMSSELDTPPSCRTTLQRVVNPSWVHPITSLCLAGPPGANTADALLRCGLPPSRLFFDRIYLFAATRISSTRPHS